MNNNNFAVGLFVAVAVAAFIAATLWLTGKQGSESTVTYSMFFEQDVGGLMLGGPVFYLGVEVGTVTAMNIVPGDPKGTRVNARELRSAPRVRVDARILESAPIDSGTYASLAFQGITGVAVIKLFAEPGQHEELKAGQESRYPVIQVRDTGFSALLSKAPAIVEKLDSVLNQINQILGDENRDLVGDMLADIADVTGELASQKESIGELPVLLKTSLEQLNSSLEQLSSMAVKMEPGLESSIANIEQMTQNLVQMTLRMEQWTANNDTDLNAFMSKGLGEVPQLVAEAQVTLREVRKLVRELREDPSALVYRPKEGAKEVEK